MVAFDLDDTLAPSKSPLPERMAAALVALLDVVPACVISGGQFGQFKTQVVDRLDAAAPDALGRLHLMPASGTQYFRFVAGEWEVQYAESLSDAERDAAMRALEEEARALGYWESETWGPILEDRGSQITFSALGQEAPVDAKKAWDPTGEKKARLAAAVAARLPELSVRSGGSTSVDVTRKGVDKAYGMRKLAEVTGIAFADMLFVGDRLDAGGNDHPVMTLGIPTRAVTGWEDTAAFVEELVELAETGPSGLPRQPG